MKIKPSYGAFPTPEAIDVNIYSMEVFGSPGADNKNKYRAVIYPVNYNAKDEAETDTDDALNAFEFESAEALDEDAWYQIDAPSDLDHILNVTVREWVREQIVDWA